MLTLQLNGLQPDSKLLDEIYRTTDKIYDALPLDSNLNVSLSQDNDRHFYKCIVKFHSLWGHSEAREYWIRPTEALRAALTSISQDIQNLRKNITQNL